jgi:hypothetical protein
VDQELLCFKLKVTEWLLPRLFCVPHCATINGGATHDFARALVQRTVLRCAMLCCTALMWRNLTPEGQLEPKSLHAGCPVLKGTK